ncbi:MAG: amidohydrolase family protein [Armatimonadota bacterium]
MLLPFHDCNCMIGTRQWRHPYQPETLSDFLADFDYYDLMSALVYHATAVEYCPDYGNRLLLREIGDNPRLIPQWVLLPHHAGEMAPPEQLIPEMLSLGVRAARMYPKSHGFGLSDDICGPLLRQLELHRIPLFIDHAELPLAVSGGTGFQPVSAVDLAKHYPNLPIVLCGVSWNFDRTIFATFAEARNLHLDTWSYQNHRGYEAFIEHFGSQRLLFSTNLPHRSPGAARMMTCYEPISEQDRRNISGQNLLRLLNNVQGAQARPVPQWTDPPAHPEDDPIVATVRAGLPLRDEFILDSHNHLGHPGSRGIDLCSFPHNDADGLIGTMDRIGVDIACPSSWAAITHATSEANDHQLDAAAKYPGRILPYGCLNPSYPKLFQSEFERIFLTGRVIGYKPAPFRQVIPLTDPIHQPVYEWANTLRKPVLCGDGPLRLAEIDILAPQYPSIPFLNAHTGSNYQFAADTVAVCSRHPNVFAELTYTSIWYGIVEYLVDQIGAERVLYGSDCIMRDLAPQVGWVAWARLPLEDKRQILGLNMARILQLPISRQTRPNQ